LEPLLVGQTLVFIHAGESTIPALLAAHWPQYVRNPHGYVAEIAQDFVLDGRFKLDSAGALVVLQIASREKSLTDEIDIWPSPLAEWDAEELEKAGSQVDIPILSVGMKRSDSHRLKSTIDLRRNLTTRTRYERAYRIYRRVVNHLLERTAEPFAAIELANSALRSRDEKQVLLQAEAHDLLSLWSAKTPSTGNSSL